MEEPSQSTTSQLCRNGCGFYGTAQNEGMCSKCYKETVQKNNSGRKSPAAHSIVSPVKSDIASSSSSKNKERHSEGAVSNAMASLATNDSYSSNCSSVASTSTNTTTMATTSVSLVPATSDVETPLNNDAATSSSASLSPPSCPSTPGADDSPMKPKKSRCATCRKRVGLTGFNCRCGKIFCGIHRYSDQHNCDYDYRADAQAKIRKENPVVVGEKVQKI